MKNQFFLGLDIGANSIGWALLEAPDNKPVRSAPRPYGRWLKIQEVLWDEL